MTTPINSETRIIYQIALVSFILLIGSMRFATVSITTAAPGLIRPAADVSIIRSPINGKVLESPIAGNTHVEQGDLLYRFDSNQLADQISAIQSKLNMEHIAETDVILALKTSQTAHPESAPAFQTPFFRQSYRTFYQAFVEVTTALYKAQTEYYRQKKLYDARVIAAMEYEGYQFDWQKADNRRNQVVETYRNQLELERRKIEEDITEWKAQLSALKLELATLSIIAPVAGDLEHLTPLHPGTFVYATQELAKIAPDTTMVVLAYVKPDYIADLTPGSLVRLQIDAFHHHQWGMAQGRVIEISSDTRNINNAWVYEVRCSIDDDFLKHSSGRIGYLKKGMTLRAHFPKYDQTIWQLIYQKADDRLNPYSHRR